MGGRGAEGAELRGGPSRRSSADLLRGHLRGRRRENRRLHRSLHRLGAEAVGTAVDARGKMSPGWRLSHLILFVKWLRIRRPVPLLP